MSNYQYDFNIYFMFLYINLLEIRNLTTYSKIN